MGSLDETGSCAFEPVPTLDVRRPTAIFSSRL
jgi:hypothetical protein